MDKLKKNSIFILLLTVVVLIFILKDNFLEIMSLLLGCNIWWLLVAIIMYIIYFIFDQLSLWNIILQFRKDIKFRFVIYLGIINKFFSGITPLSTGGQPAQIYALHKKGVSISDGTNMEIQAFMVFQIAVMLFGFISITINHIFGLFEKVPLLREMTIIGFTINFILLVLVFLVSFSENFNRIIINFIINILHKIHIVKHINKQKNKWNKICDEYYINAKELLHNKSTFFRCVLFQLISLSLYYVLPFFLAKSLGCADNLTIYSSIAASSYVFIAFCLVPMPGATGGMEYGFMGFFGNFIAGYHLNALLLSWRFLTFYVPTIIGAIVFNLKSNKLFKF
ncbi:MAG: flippase-like domain-containing protein [Bacilli bacterium]|nr:flippase-like domain-containing protein [Bacilli bacterium]